MVADYSVSFETAMNVVQNCLVVTLQGEIPDEKFVRIRNDILNKIYSVALRGMILDLSQVRILDRFSFTALADTSKMALLMGVQTIFSGLQPGVVSALVDLEVDVSGIHTTLTLEDAFLQLSSGAQTYEAGEEDEEISAAVEQERHGDGDE
jgi:rsbT antagonist protein RsbS